MWGMTSPGFFRDGNKMSWDVALDPHEATLGDYREHGLKAEAARDAAAREGKADEMYAEA